MELTNKRTNYSIQNANDFVKLSGEFGLSEENKIINFSGSLNKVADNTSIGSFWYSTTSEGKVNTNFNEVPSDVLSSVMTFVLDSVESAIAEIEK